MSRQERLPDLLRYGEITRDNIDSLQSREQILRILIQLIVEVAHENDIPLSMSQKMKAETVQVFTDFSEFIKYNKKVSGIDYSTQEQLFCRATLILGQGFSENVWHKNEHFWAPLIFVKAHQVGGERQFSITLLHELRHAAEMIVLPLDKEQEVKRASSNKQIFLSLMVVWMTVLGEAILQSESKTTPEINNAFLAAAIFAFTNGLANLGKYYFNDEERRARETSKRIRE